MEIDIAQLAAQTAAFLAPYLPYLVKGGKIAAKKAFEKAGEIFAEKGWEQAEALWEKLHPKVEAKPAAQDAIERAIIQPENKRVQENLQRNLEFQLEDIFGDDSSLARFVAENLTFDFSSNINTGEKSIVGTINGIANTGDNPIFVAEGGQATLLLDPRFVQTPVDAIPDKELTLAYLRGIANECSELPLGIVDPRFLEKAGKNSITLPGVYIDLDVQPPGEEDQAKRKSEEPLLEREREKRVQVLEAISGISLRRVVLLGDPGSGKTTCLHYLAYSLSIFQQGDKSASDLFPEGWALRDFFPIRLVLREVAAQHIPQNSRIGTADMIWSALRADLTTRLGRDISAVLFPKIQERILKKPCLVMFDGLDEVTETDQRRERLIEAINIFTGLLPKETCVIVTARPYAYSDPKWQLPGFKPLTLLPFSAKQIERFVSRWYLSVRKSMKWDETAAGERGQSLSSAVKEKDYLFDLAARPLLLTLMATLHTSWGKLPEDRADLYDQIVSLLLDRWQRWRDTRDAEGNPYTEKSISVALSIDEKNIRKALNQLAFSVHTRQGADTNRQPAPADIRRDEVLDAFAPFLPDDVHPRVIINYLETRAGLLLGRGESIYSFPHRSFQEYLSACYINDLPDPAAEYSERIQKDPTWWREVYLLGIGKMSRGGLGIAIAAVQTVLLNLAPESERNEQEWRALSLAGQAITEMKLGPNALRYEKLIGSIRSSLVSLLEGSRLTPRERAEAGDTLARLGDPRPGVLNDFLFCEIPVGKFLMGNTKETDPESYDDERPQFEYDIKHNYLISRYPVTNAQFDLFVNDPEGYKNETWYTEAGREWLKNAKQDRPPRQGGAFDLPNHPVVNVTWYESVAFVRWLTAKIRRENLLLKVWSDGSIREIAPDLAKWEARLPSEAEWERAARGEKGQRYPWGDEFEQERVNNNMIVGSTSAVGCFPLGRSPYGLLDMSGNAWEWCATGWTDNYENYGKNEKTDFEGDAPRVVRGGAFYNDEGLVRCAYRIRHAPVYRNYPQGFRVVVSPFF